jgi:hypothetical protein
MPGPGIEPGRSCDRGILSPLRLPIPPSRLRAYYFSRRHRSVTDFLQRCNRSLLPFIVRTCVGEDHRGRPMSGDARDGGWVMPCCQEPNNGPPLAVVDPRPVQGDPLPDLVVPVDGQGVSIGPRLSIRPQKQGRSRRLPRDQWPQLGHRAGREGVPDAISRLHRHGDGRRPVFQPHVHTGDPHQRLRPVAIGGQQLPGRRKVGRLPCFPLQQQRYCVVRQQVRGGVLSPPRGSESLAPAGRRAG